MHVLFPRLRASVLAFAVLTAALFPKDARRAEEAPLERIAFGSCAKQDKPQPIWDAVVETKPERFLFIGDNIYGDSQDMSVLRAKYAMLGAQPGYRKLLQTCPILATWDDHDYGVNDGGADYVRKNRNEFRGIK